MKEVQKYLLDTIHVNDTIVVAVSSGIDSMVLLHLFINLRKDKEIKIVCAHVNHKKRIESDEEAVFLENYCNENNIIFEMTTFDSYGDDNFQMEARERRYAFFQQMVKKYNANYLTTAHHGDDLMETILMRLTRGSTLKGYSGFEKETRYDKYTLIRPLIPVTKDDILAYARKQSIPFSHDVSNDSDLYTRNRFRKQVIPFLKQEHETVLKQFIKFSEMACELDSFVEKQIDAIWDKVYQNDILSILELLKLDIVLQKRIIHRLLTIHYGNDITSIDGRHVEEIFKVIHSKKTNILFSLPKHKILKKTYGMLSIVEEESSTDYQFELKDSVIVHHMKIELVEACESKGNDTIRLNSKEIELPLWVRNRRNGDKIELKGTNGSRSIGDIFTDVKMDIAKRKTYPIITDNRGKILFVPKLKKSKYDKSLKENYDIIIKCI